LEECDGILTRYGGHRQAAGVTLDRGRVEEFRERFNAVARRILSDDDLRPHRDLDAEIKLNELENDSADEILSLAPFGLGNRAPAFLLRDVELRQPAEPLGRDGKHLRFFVHDGSRRLFLKAWRFADRAPLLQPGTRIDVAVSIEHDSYGQKRGYAPWGAIAQDVRPATH
jgi:single-stranded-DNA-specific exonuclease